MSGMDFEGVKKEFLHDEDMTLVMLISFGYLEQSKILYQDHIEAATKI